MITTASYNMYEVLGGLVVTGIDAQSSITATLIIERIDGNAIDWPYEHNQMITEGAMPSVDDSFPAGTGNTIEPFMLLRSVQMTVLPSGKMSALCTYSTRFTWLRGAKNEAGGSVSDLALMAPSVQNNAKHRTIQTYRRGWATQPPSTLDTTAADIGGSELSSGDKGAPVEVRQIQVRLRLLVDCVGTSLTAMQTNVASYFGRRNSDTFLGYAAQTLVCEGASINHVDNEYYEINVEYCYDEWYEHAQVVELDIDGKPKRSPGGALLRVDWKRPNRSTATFNSIWPAGDYGRVQRRICEIGVYY
jgi:hypothetical protein